VSAAWLFPGQGSQYVGMGTAWADRSARARETLAEAADTLGFDLPRLVAEGPERELADTYNQQPSLLAVSVAILRAAGESLPKPAFVAGHSLGEYCALVAVGAMGFTDALRLVRERGRLMRLAGERQPGRMAAVLGLDDSVVEGVCAAVDGVQVANYNAPGQVVISGTTEAVGEASRELEGRGAKRTVVLPITIAAHSRLMDSVAGEFRAAVAEVTLHEARAPVVANVSARPIADPADIRAELSAQLTASVRWTDSVRLMAESGVDEFVEVGPGSVLCGLVRRIHRADGLAAPRLVALSEPAG
jgi:[acyl-carrier-protein] S-malonyltransferase